MIPMNDLSLQYHGLKKDICKSIDKVLEHGQYIMGPEVYELEKKLAEYVGIRYAISCSSGTDALLLTLLAWEVGKGDAVFTTPFTFIATSEVISLLGATPVFVDIDSETFNISSESLDEAIKKTIEEGKLKPKAILPVDLFGLPADYDRIEAIAKTYDMKVLEDAAQSFGGLYKGKRVGSFGNAATTSFFPAKPLGCYGDGGAIFTDDPGLHEKLKSIRIHGKGLHKYDNVQTGINGRLDTIQAAILLTKLSVFDEELKLRNDVAKKYSNSLEGIVLTPQIPHCCSSSWAQYSVLAENFNERELFIQTFKKNHIQTAIYYQKPLHLQTVYRDLGYNKGDLKVAENISNRIFSLPMHPYLSDETVEHIVNTMNKTSQSIK